MTTMVIDKLQQFGLSEREARVYAALQWLGTSVVSDIAKKSGINRSTAYVLLDALAKRGLVSVSERGGIRVYSPAPAERFMQMAESSLAKWNTLVETSRELLLKFKKQTRGSESRPTVQFFEGVEGIKTVYKILLIPKEAMRSFSALSVMQETLPDFFTNYRMHQMTEKIRARTVVPDTPRNREILVRDAGTCECFLAPSGDYASDFVISGDKVAFISFDEPSALIIENTAFAALQKVLFDALLTQTPRFNVNPETTKSKSSGKYPALVKATRRFFSS